MIKRKFLISAALILMVICSACSSLSLPLSAASTPISAASTAQAEVESKLGPGILKLEGTGQAITTEQASELLFLWKGVKALTSIQSSSKFELAALYTQIEQSLTADQVQAIQQLNLTQTELNAMQTQFGARLAQGGAVANTSAKTSSSSQSQSNSGGFAGGPGGGGPGGGSDVQLIMGGSGAIPSTSATTTSSTASQKPATPAKVSVDLNALFTNSVIALLQQRVGL